MIAYMYILRWVAKCYYFCQESIMTFSMWNYEALSSVADALISRLPK